MTQSSRSIFCNLVNIPCVYVFRCAPTSAGRRREACRGVSWISVVGRSWSASWVPPARWPCPARRGRRSSRVADHSADVALRWIETTYDLVLRENLSPPAAARVYAHTAIAMYEALVAGMPDRLPLAGQLTGLRASGPVRHKEQIDWPSALVTAAAPSSARSCPSRRRPRARRSTTPRRRPSRLAAVRSPMAGSRRVWRTDERWAGTSPRGRRATATPARSVAPTRRARRVATTGSRRPRTTAPPSSRTSPRCGPWCCGPPTKSAGAARAVLDGEGVCLLEAGHGAVRAVEGRTTTSTRRSPASGPTTRARSPRRWARPPACRPGTGCCSAPRAWRCGSPAGPRRRDARDDRHRAARGLPQLLDLEVPLRPAAPGHLRATATSTRRGPRWSTPRSSRSTPPGARSPRRRPRQCSPTQLGQLHLHRPLARRAGSPAAHIRLLRRTRPPSRGSRSTAASTTRTPSRPASSRDAQSAPRSWPACAPAETR